MSFLFNGSAKLVLGSAPITAVPLTMACFFNKPALTSQNIMALDEGAAAVNGWLLVFNVTGAIAAFVLATTSQNATTTDIAILNTWQSCAEVTQSITSRYSVLNGNFSAQSVGSRTPAGVAEFIIGTRGSGATPFIGLIAEVALWNAALTPSEMRDYHAGVPASLIRPESLLLYMPLRDSIRDAGPQQYVLTNTAAVPNSDHPLILRPVKRRGLLRPTRA